MSFDDENLTTTTIQAIQFNFTDLKAKNAIYIFVMFAIL